MQSENEGKTRRTVLLAVAMILLGVIAAAWFMLSQRTPAPAVPVAASPAAAAVRAPVALPPADLATLEKRQQDLAQAYGEAMRKYARMRRQWLDNNKDALALEVAASRRAVEDAIDHHPAIVALKQEMAGTQDDAFKASLKQAELLTKLHNEDQSRSDTYRTTANDIFKRMSEEQSKTILEPSGKKDFSHLTEAEAKLKADIQNRYMVEYKALAEQNQNHQPSADDVKLMAEYKALGERRIAVDDRYTEIYYTLPTARARVRADDPAIAALDRALTQKNAQWLASMTATPEIAACLAEVQEIKRKQGEVAAQLDALKSQSASTPNPAPTPAARTNG